MILFGQDFTSGRISPSMAAMIAILGIGTISYA
jgi:hypothetical protein